MTKKDYKAIAEAFNNIRLRYPGPGGYDIGFNDGISAAANELCSTFRSDNPRFDREKFLKACGANDANDKARAHETECRLAAEALLREKRKSNWLAAKLKETS